VKQADVVKTLWGQPKGGGGASETGSTSSGPDITERLSTDRTQGVKPTAQGVLDLQFGYQNLAASLAASQAYRTIPGVTTTSVQQGVQMLYRGSVVAIALRANAAKTAGSAVFAVYLAAQPSGAQLSWTTGQSLMYTTFTPGTYPFTGGEELDVRVTTDVSFLPTTVDLEVIVYVTFDAE
jgi:hypothetical protein